MHSDDKRIVNVRLSDGSAVKLECRDRLPSTTQLAKEYANLGYPDRYAIFTQLQSLSPITKTKLSENEYEEGVFLSCILRPSLFPSQMGLVGPLAAVALVTALDDHSASRSEIGWVSDVYSEGIHIGGVAVEGKLDSFSSYEYLIVSFAVRLDKKKFPPRMTDMIKQVFEKENFSVPMIIAKEILHKFLTVYSSLRAPEKYMKIYREKFALIGQKIKYRSGSGREAARVVDVDTGTCALVIENKNKERITINSPSGVIIPKKLKPLGRKRMI